MIPDNQQMALEVMNQLNEQTNLEMAHKKILTGKISL